MEYPIKYITERIYDAFLQPPISKEDFEIRKQNVNSLVRFNNDKLKVGDFNFSVKRSDWLKYFAEDKLDVSTFCMFEDFDQNKLSTFFQLWYFWKYPVVEMRMLNERYNMTLERKVAMPKIIELVLADPKKSPKNDSHRSIHLELLPIEKDEVNKNENLSYHRAKLVREVLGRILQYHDDWCEVTTAESKKCNDYGLLELQVLSIATKQFNLIEASAKNNKRALIKCGLVCDSVSKKYCQMKTAQYLSLRTKDMQLTAMHKYGFRTHDENILGFEFERLGYAAVTVDLLGTKHSSPVQTVLNGQGNDKGASFIFYNSARIETLLRTFDERVAKGQYSPLPDLKDVNFDLLKEQDEWQLLYGYVGTFPQLIERCVDQIENGICATHLIIRFLNAFVALFSGYYKRTRILVENRDTLIPQLYARIYLVRAVRETLNKVMALLDIEPVKFM